MKFSDQILSWYQHNKRELPWRKGTSYQVFLSEVMLQQTQVKTVIPFFHRFLERFPNLSTLANSSLDEVYQVWQGLGYYHRARNMHKTAQIWSALGRDPRNYAEWIALPGVGPYTASILTAILLEHPAAAIDGNIKRILQRYFGLETIKEVKMVAENVLPSKNYGNYTQGLMDLGAMICTPKTPKCSMCPIAEFCKFKQGTWMPSKKAKNLKSVRYGHVYLCKKEDALWSVKNTESKLLKGLWGFPLSDLKEEEQSSYIEVPLTCLKGTVRHVFTHFILELRIWNATSRIEDVTSKWSNGKWLDFQQRKELGFSRLMRKIEEQENIWI
ncbi:A/G-specific adenine glycosylase [Holospora obtusa F1]|uniref:Adenine DNA glycosylase n=1 Tax=Holospora obtusa F1 TaxID=1399147 RepID=W6TD25_HOLOB|nr:A/G-specific adenine glycosylase [Holospora obtusa]ETZ06788.1 A/G-specific adenine glycosylase [Holospora obtusa F1]